MQVCEIAVIVTHSHCELRRMLDRLDVLITEIGSNGHTEGRFYGHCENVKRALLAHMEIEEALIVPLLRALPDCGKAEADSLIQHHEAQRRWLSCALDGEKDLTDAETLRAVQALAHVLRVDMDHEEAALVRLVQSAKQARRVGEPARHR